MLRHKKLPRVAHAKGFDAYERGRHNDRVNSIYSNRVQGVKVGQRFAIQSAVRHVPTNILDCAATLDSSDNVVTGYVLVFQTDLRMYHNPDGLESPQNILRQGKTVTRQQILFIRHDSPPYAVC
jgi:hypothetical protein